MANYTLSPLVNLLICCLVPILVGRALPVFRMRYGKYDMSIAVFGGALGALFWGIVALCIELDWLGLELPINSSLKYLGYLSYAIYAAFGAATYMYVSSRFMLRKLRASRDSAASYEIMAVKAGAPYFVEALPIKVPARIPAWVLAWLGSAKVELAVLLGMLFPPLGAVLAFFAVLRLEAKLARQRLLLELAYLTDQAAPPSPEPALVRAYLAAAAKGPIFIEQNTAFAALDKRSRLPSMIEKNQAYADVAAARIQAAHAQTHRESP